MFVVPHCRKLTLIFFTIKKYFDLRLIYLELIAFDRIDFLNLQKSFLFRMFFFFFGEVRKIINKILVH